VILETEDMLPAAGQGALGIEVRADDGRIAAVCERLNHYNTRQCVTAERTFLAEMGGGCQSPVAAYGEIIESHLRLRAVSFRDEKKTRRGEVKGPIKEAAELGRRLAEELK
jgi:hydroxymethylbilane synthase